ncbi:N-acetylglucosamine-6-phosphate deacetylase [Spirochaeta dissipatitropha]
MAASVIHNAKVFTGITVVEKSAVIFQDGIIEDVCSDKRAEQKDLPADTEWINAEGNIVAPGFVDTHIHGIGGWGTEDHSTEAILNMSRELVRYGVTSFCPTIYPQAENDFIASIHACRDAIGKEPGARILGIHLEGPFISPEKPGVQLPIHFKAVDLDAMQRYIDESGNNILNMTVAPELKNMRNLALFCARKGIVLQAGHTNATYENMVEGIEAGILHSTHFFNAMRRLNHRDPGVVGAIMIHPEIACEIIADGFHVHPAIVRLLLGEKAANKVVLVTDALKTTKQTSGALIANGEQVYLDENIFRRVEDDIIAGSALTMDVGVANLISWGVALDEALAMASSNPSHIMQKDKQIGSLLPGHNADLVICDKNIEIQATYVQGRQCYKKGA